MNTKLIDYIKVIICHRITKIKTKNHIFYSIDKFHGNTQLPLQLQFKE